MKSQHKTLFMDVGSHSTTMGCWEFNPNLSLPTQLFAHQTIIF